MIFLFQSPDLFHVLKQNISILQIAQAPLLPPLRDCSNFSQISAALLLIFYPKRHYMLVVIYIMIFIK